MHNLKHLPSEIERKLSQFGLRKEDLIYAAQIDLNLEGEMSRGCLLLTAQQLIGLFSDPIPGEVFEFKGSSRRQSKYPEREWRVQSWSLDSFEKFSVLRTVGGGVLYGEGPDTRLAAFTNLEMSQVTYLVKLIKALKNKGEVTAEDFEGEEEEEYCPTCGCMYPDKNRRVCPRCMDKGTLVMRMVKWFKPHSKEVFYTALCIVLTGLLNLVWPYLSGTVLYDHVLKKNDAFVEFLGLPGGEFVAALILVVIVMILTKAMMQVVGIIQGVVSAKMVTNIVRDVKTQIFENMSKLSIGFYTSRQTGGLMTRVLNDTEYLTGFLYDLPYSIVNIVTLVFSLIMMFSINWRLALVSAAIMPLVIYLAVKLAPKVNTMYGKRHRAERAMNAKIHDNLTGARVVKSFGREKEEIEAFQKRSDRVKETDLSLVSYSNYFYVIFNVAKYMMKALSWGFGAYLIVSNTNMELGVLLTFVGYISQLDGPIDMFSYFIRKWSECRNSAQRILEILDSIPEITEKENPVELENFQGNIRLENVTFGYEANKPVLKNIDLEVKAGEMLGVVGRSGAGKTTMISLISRLYDPQEGHVYLDGVDVRDLSFKSLRGEVVMVSQETYIFMGSVRDNIAYAKPGASTEEIVRAAKLASAHDFICAMPDGYDTQVGSNGRDLSGGERQRISIARAILADPKVLILDEATAAVDTETEKAIQESLNYLVKGRTTISIAHRLSTLRDADRLVVLDNGKITEEGTHEELIAQKGTYYKLKELQTKALAMRGLE